MNNVFVICAIFLFVKIVFSNNLLESSEGLSELAQEIHEKCQKESGVEEAILDEMENGALPKDRKLKCYINCWFETAQLYDENDDIHLESIIEVLPPEEEELVNKLIDLCGTIHGADRCETAYLTAKCYTEVDPLLLTLIER